MANVNEDIQKLKVEMEKLKLILICLNQVRYTLLMDHFIIYVYQLMQKMIFILKTKMILYMDQS